MKKILLIFCICIISLKLIAEVLFFFSIKRVHPDSNFAIEKVTIDGSDTYHLTLVSCSFEGFEPNVLAREGMRGVYLSHPDLYIDLGHIYHINLITGKATEIDRSACTVQFIDPDHFWHKLPVINW